MTKHEYTATATREGRWWVVDVGELGMTQGRSVAEARHMANDLAAAMLDVPITDVDVSVEFRVGGRLGAKVQEALEANLEAELAKSEAAINYRRVVSELKTDGLSGNDIAAVLGIAPQRVSQLAKLSPEEPRKQRNSLIARAKQRGLTIRGNNRTSV
ncbi:hypothetical protein [Saccharopolyspora tripterygii]